MSTQKILSGIWSKQGDPLSRTLFRVVVDVILKVLHLRGNVFTRLK
jgi:hypothetical protein